jgi:hypothetical protein
MQSITFSWTLQSVLVWHGDADTEDFHTWLHDSLGALSHGESQAAIVKEVTIVTTGLHEREEKHDGR